MDAINMAASVLAFLVLFCLMVVLCLEYRFRRNRRNVALPPEYKLYETAPMIAGKWYDGKLIEDACDFCGMADAPIVLGHRHDELAKKRRAEYFGETYYPTKASCKWCQELANLNYHLARNGARRFRKSS